MVVRRPDSTTTSSGADDCSADDFYRQEWTGAVRLAWLLTGNRWAAEDLAQDAFVAMSHLRHVENPRAYLRTALVNASRSRFRRLAVERRYRADPMPATLQPEFDDLLVAIRRIPERHRTALILRYYADLSVEQVATTMGCPFATAKSLIQRGLVQLRKELASDG
jgi:RNA polymerase sigma factor (sigma-70 family)